MLYRIALAPNTPTADGRQRSCITGL